MQLGKYPHTLHARAVQTQAFSRTFSLYFYRRLLIDFLKDKVAKHTLGRHKLYIHIPYTDVYVVCLSQRFLCDKQDVHYYRRTDQPADASGEKPLNMPQEQIFSFILIAGK
jgi:hypothetical protein